MKLAIMGAGGHGRVVADAAEVSGIWTEIVFFDAKWPTQTEAGPWKIVGNFDNLLASIGTYAGVIVAIGVNAIRVAHFEKLQDVDAPLVSIIHPRSTVSAHAYIGRGTAILGGAVINIGASVGDACIINTAATVDHDCQLGTGVHICPGANLAGEVQVGCRSWVGIGAAVREQITIESDVTIGAGAVVVQPQFSGSTVVGNPARILHRK